MYNSFVQPGWRDSDEGIFEPGRRLDPDTLLRHGFSQHIVDEIRRGHEYPLSHCPQPSSKGNYKSFNENLAVADADVARLLKAGYIEGPLPC